MAEAIYDVNRGGDGCGWDLTLPEALKQQAKHGGTVMVSRDNGRTWQTHDPEDG